MKYKFFGWACLLVLMFAAMEVYGWIYGPHYDERAWHYRLFKGVFVLLLAGTAGFLVTLAVYFFTL